MTNEAVLRDTKPLVSRRYTCHSGLPIAKGDYLYNLDPHTASLAIVNGAPFIGFAHADVNKDTDSSFNTETAVTADKGGMYELVASNAILVNSYVKVAAPGNMVMQAADIDIGSMAIIVGIAREAAADAETINVEVLP